MILHPRDERSRYAGREGAPYVPHLDGEVIAKCMRLHGDKYFVTSEHCVLTDADVPPCAILYLEDRETGRSLYRRDGLTTITLQHAADPRLLPPPGPGATC